MPLDESAVEHEVGELEAGVLRVERELYVAILLGKNRLQQIGRLLGQDERGTHPGSHCLVLEAYQLVRIGSHKRDAILENVEIDTVHDGTQLVFGRSKQRAADAVEQLLGIERKVDSRGIHRHLGGILVAIHPDEVVTSVLEMKEDFEIVVIDFESQRLVGQLFERFEQYFGIHGKNPFAMRFHHIDGRSHGGLLVRCCHREARTFEAEQEIVENGHRVFRVDNPADSLQMG